MKLDWVPSLGFSEPSYRGVRLGSDSWNRLLRCFSSCGFVVEVRRHSSFGVNFGDMLTTAC